MLRTALILGRVSNLPTVWTNVFAGWFVAGGSWSWELLWIQLGVSLLYVAGMTLNDAFDAEWDRKHAPERPIPSGAISAGSVWAMGLLQLISGVVVLGFATSVDWYWIAGLVTAILLYDWLHKKTALAVWVMGACRGLVYLLAGSAVDPEQLGWWWALATSLYVVGITVLARSERAADAGKAKSGWLALPMLMAPMVVSFFVSPPDPITKIIGLAYLIPLGVWLARTLIEQKVTGAIGPMVARLIAGIVLIDLAILGMSDALVAAGIALVLLPITLLLQRYIPAT